MHQEMTKEAAEEFLELPHRYTRDDLHHAYVALARRYHPDRAARSHFDPAEAEARMVRANLAHSVLKREFDADPDRVVVRELAKSFDYVTSHLDEISPGWSSEETSERVPVGVRSVLLGPVVLRVALVGVLALIWVRTFPLLEGNVGRYVPAGGWTLFSAARLVAAMVYPTYWLAYEALTGYVSGLVREVANGAVSWVTGRYVDLRPRSYRYGCSLSKLLREQVYSLLLAPVALYAGAAFAGARGLVAKFLWLVVALALGVDALAAVTHGGFVNVWTAALAERAQDSYLLLRVEVLKRCGRWEGHAERGRE